MIPAITEVNFPQYATLHQATVSLQEMGERNITTQVRIDGDVAPNFDGWELRFKGERFILNTKEPQAAKDNSTRNSLVDLTFTSWVINELKRYYFFEPSSVDAGTVVADKYKTPVGLNIEDFVVLFNKVLDYYFDGNVVMSLFMSGQGRYSTDRAYMDIDYTYIWDVLTKFFEIYGERWRIEYNSTTDVYTIKVGYEAPEITDHDFEYGYQGGLLRFERQVQDVDIRNILLGRGGEKNLPYRYFKLAEEVSGTQWAGDPDAIPELASINFDRLRDVNFRWYVRGWMQNPNRDTSWDATHTFPSYTDNDCPPAYLFAFQKGKTDEKFNPVEYVKDDRSIADYGERWGAVDDNDEVYPTIQGVSRDPIGRIDETVAVSEIVTDDIDAMAKNAAVEKSINPLTISTGSNQTQYTLQSEQFTIPSGSTGNIDAVPTSKETVAPGGLNYVDTDQTTMVVVNTATGTELPISGIPAGTYRLKINLVLHIGASSGLAIGTFGYENIRLTISEIDTEAWKPTFDIWVKNIWNTAKTEGESDVQYAERVWLPILGDRAGNEAKVVFSTGFMSVSEDYEFVIVSYPVRDTSKSIITTDSEGHTVTVPSEWRITLRKSDAEFDATGLYIPNATTGGAPVAGDKFFFTGIDMPHMYVELAEEDLNTAKSAELDNTAKVNPTWIINLDKVRVHTLEDGEYGQTLADRLAAGAKVWITDPRFTPGSRLQLYVQSITYTWNEPTENSPYLVPDIEVVLSDKVVSVESALGRLQNEVNVVKEQYARISDVEAAVRSVAEPLFLKKTGESDSSDSPTQFASKVTSKGFRQGGIGGTGWGIYRDNTAQLAEAPQPTTRALLAAAIEAQSQLSDEDNQPVARTLSVDAAEPQSEQEGDSVIEFDRAIIRKELQVNSLVINQITYVGGKEIISAAKMEVSKVIEYDSYYDVYFDQRQNSVANLFQVGDIAYGQRWSADESNTSYYKMVVNTVGLDYIRLTKTPKDGSGVPTKGDVIVQYGNVSVSARQYVIIRDVIGGGYERMLSGLNSVSAEGEEYYFAGRQSGSTPRWFVGDAHGENAEWKNGQLNIKGRMSVLNDQGAYVAMDAYMNAVRQRFNEQQAQIDGQTQSWASGEAQTPQTKPYPLWDEETSQIIGTTNYPASEWNDNTEREKHFGDIYIDDTTGQGYRYTKGTLGGVLQYYWTRITDEELALALSLARDANDKVDALDYLKEATNEGATLVDGGLILSNLIALGKTLNQQFKVWAGINGLRDTTKPGNGIAAWFGGEMMEKDEWDALPAEQKVLHEYAKSLFRFIGSGYLASKKIHWDEEGYGGIPGITWSKDPETGQDVITIGGDVKLASVTGDDITTLLNALRDMVTIDDNQTVTGVKNFANGMKVGDGAGATEDSKRRIYLGGTNHFLELHNYGTAQEPIWGFYFSHPIVSDGDQVIGDRSSVAPGGGSDDEHVVLSAAEWAQVTDPDPTKIYLIYEE